MNQQNSNWNRFLEWYCKPDETDISLDISRMDFETAWWRSMQIPMANALQQMKELEAGSIANPD